MKKPPLVLALIVATILPIILFKVVVNRNLKRAEETQLLPYPEKEEISVPENVYFKDRFSLINVTKLTKYEDDINLKILEIKDKITGDTIIICKGWDDNMIQVR